MSDALDKFIAEQRANDPEFAKAYDDGKTLETRARSLEAILWQAGHRRLKWYTILAVLEADRELD